MAADKRQALARIQKLTTANDQILSELPDEKLWPDEMVVRLRSFSRQIGQQAWRVECACDAELLSRATRLQGGRAQEDEEQKGVRATAKRVAARLGVDPSAVFLNAQIHRTFFNCGADQETSLDVQTSLLEKSFYVVALGADDPLAAIEQIASARQEDPDFSVRDARRLMRQSRRALVNIEPIAAIKDVQDRALKEHLAKAIKTIHGLVGDCPSPTIGSEYNLWLRWLIKQRDRTPEKDQKEVAAVLAMGCFTIEDIADETGLPQSDVKEILGLMVTAGLVKASLKGGETDVARGSRMTIYRLVEKN